MRPHNIVWASLATLPKMQHQSWSFPYVYQCIFYTFLLCYCNAWQYQKFKRVSWIGKVEDFVKKRDGFTQVSLMQVICTKSMYQIVSYYQKSWSLKLILQGRGEIIVLSKIVLSWLIGSLLFTTIPLEQEENQLLPHLTFEKPLDNYSQIPIL